MSQRTFKGIPREEIPWFPQVDEAKCTGCGVCVGFCQYGVYEQKEGKARVVNPYGCVVGCSGCISQCPEGAISFPSLTSLRELLRSLRATYGQTEG